MTESLLGFNEQIERVLKVGVVLVIGAMLTPQFIPWHDLWFVAVLFLLIRPITVITGAAGRNKWPEPGEKSDGSGQRAVSVPSSASAGP